MPAKKKSAPKRPAKKPVAKKVAPKKAASKKPAARKPAPAREPERSPYAPARPMSKIVAKALGKTTRSTSETMVVEWAVFGEFARVLALRVARHFDPEIVVGIATAGVVPAAAVAAMLDRPFHSIIVSRRYHSESVRDTPAVLSGAPADVIGKRVLIVDETCTSGDTLRLARAAIINAGASEVRTAVSFKTGTYQPDYFALETEARIVLPWDREQIVNGELRLNPKYADLDGV
jgi:hypoxanthine phosphoribosyltransferase